MFNLKTETNIQKTMKKLMETNPKDFAEKYDIKQDGLYESLRAGRFSVDTEFGKATVHTDTGSLEINGVSELEAKPSVFPNGTFHFWSLLSSEYIRDRYMVKGISHNLSENNTHKKHLAETAVKSSIETLLNNGAAPVQVFDTFQKYLDSTFPEKLYSIELVPAKLVLSDDKAETLGLTQKTLSGYYDKIREDVPKLEVPRGLSQQRNDRDR